MNRSPIETMLSDAIVIHGVAMGYRVHDFAAHYDNGGEQLTWSEGGGFAPRDPEAYFHAPESARVLALVPDVRIAGYRVDLLVPTPTGPLAIECDGHDWHDRTKQQASYDRARDRALLRAGVLSVVRFTGSDIHRDAEQCAREIIETLKAVCRRAASRQGLHAPPEEHW